MRTLIAVPCYDMMDSAFVRCLMELDRPDGCNFALITNTMIYDARNLIAQKAVEEGFDRVMWFDSDMTFAPDTMLRLSAEMNTGKDYVTGLYVKRKAPIFPVISKEMCWRVHDDGNVEAWAKSFLDYPRNDVFEVAASGFGCVMTSVDLLRDMVDRYGSPFTPLMGIGEDYAFCYRATKAGYHLYCDSRVKCGHIGRKEFTEDDCERY